MVRPECVAGFPQEAAALGAVVMLMSVVVQVSRGRESWCG